MGWWIHPPVGEAGAGPGAAAESVEGWGATLNQAQLAGAGASGAGDAARFARPAHRHADLPAVASRQPLLAELNRPGTMPANVTAIASTATSSCAWPFASSACGCWITRPASAIWPCPRTVPGPSLTCSLRRTHSSPRNRWSGRCASRAEEKTRALADYLPETSMASCSPTRRCRKGCWRSWAVESCLRCRAGPGKDRRGINAGFSGCGAGASVISRRADLPGRHEPGVVRDRRHRGDRAALVGYPLATTNGRGGWRHCAAIPIWPARPRWPSWLACAADLRVTWTSTWTACGPTGGWRWG